MRPSPIPREARTCAARDVAGGSGHATVVRPAGDGARVTKEDRVYLGRVVYRARGIPEPGAGDVPLRPGDRRVRARAAGRRGGEEAQRPRHRHGARRVVRRRVPAGLVPEIGRADGLRRRVRPRRARHGAGEAGALRARRPRRPPRRGLAAPTYARLPCPRARMASQEVSEHVEHVDDPHLTAHRTLPLDVERAGQRTVHCHSVVNVRDGTFRVEWQCRPHCHSVVSVPHWYDQGRVAVRPVRSWSSGSASHTATR